MVLTTRTLLKLSSQVTSSVVSEGTGNVGQQLSAVGVDVYGNVTVPTVPNPTDTLVAFVLRSTTFDADLKYWDAVWQRTSEGQHVSLVAFCGDRRCVGLAGQLEVKHFPVVGYGQVASLERIARADKEGSALIVSYDGTIKESLPWRGATPDVTSSHLMEVQ